MKNLLMLTLLLSACEVVEVVENDVALCGVDAGPSDAAPDASSVDASAPDAFIADASVPDASAPDAATHTYRRFHLLADSVPVYGASTTATRAASLLAATYPGVFYNQAVGGRTFHFYAYDEPRRASMTYTIAYGPPNGPWSPPPTEVYIEMGYNDRGASVWNAAAFQAAYSDFVDKLLAVLPFDSIIYCQTIHVTGTTPNSQGSSVNDYSAAIAAACTGKGPRVIIVDGLSFGFIRPGDYFDSVHLNDSGHAKMAAAVRTIVGW